MPHDAITIKLLHGDGELFLTNLLKDENMRYHHIVQMYPIVWREMLKEIAHSCEIMLYMEK